MSCARPRASTRTKQQGTVLLLFALLVLALMGIAALTVDIGYAVLAQSQMQNAVDTAAIEGARLRDYNVESWYSNRSRRSRVEEMVRQTFDDDLNPISEIEYFYEPNLNLPGDSDQDRLGFAMGPRIALVGGDPQNNIGALIEEQGLPYLDDPIIQPNQPNFPYGDMLSGTFDPLASAAENPDTYERADFLPADPNSYDPIAGNNDLYESLGFLVRLRRTKGDNALESLNGYSSRGETIPFLFALGTGIHQTPGAEYNPRTDGLTVRATAVAAAAPAFSIGYPPCREAAIYPDASVAGTRMVGHYGVMLSQQFWEAITEEPGHTLWTNYCYQAKLDPNTGKLTLQQVSGCIFGSTPPPPVWAQPFLDDPNLEIGWLADRGNVVGDRVYPLSLTAFQNGADRDADGDITPEDAAAARCRWIGLVDGTVFNIGQEYGDERGFFGIYAPIEEPGPGSTTVQVRRVIGFGFGRAVLTLGNVATGEPPLVTFGAGLPNPHQNVGCWVAQDNASPHMQLALLKEELDLISADVWGKVLRASHRFTFKNYDSDPEAALAVRYDYKNIRLGVVLAATLVR